MIIRKPLNPLEKYFPCSHVQIPYKILSCIPKSDPDSCCIEVSDCFWKRACYSNGCTLFFKVSDLDFDMFSGTNSPLKNEVVMWCFNPASITGCPCGSYSHNPQLMRRLLPYHQNHETNPSGLQPQATNGKILEGLSWNWKKRVSWHVTWRRNHESYEPSGCHFSRRLHSGNTYKHVLSEPFERGQGFALWAVRPTVWGRQTRKKVPWTRESKRGDGVPGKPEPRWWDCPNTGGQVCQSLSPPRRGATSLRGPLRFLSITYQPGQSVVEIKQLPQSGWPLNTAGGELSQVTYLVKLEKVY